MNKEQLKALLKEAKWLCSLESKRPLRESYIIQALEIILSYLDLDESLDAIIAEYITSLF